MLVCEDLTQNSWEECPLRLLLENCSTNSHCTFRRPTHPFIQRIQCTVVMRRWLKTSKFSKRLKVPNKNPRPLPPRATTVRVDRDNNNICDFHETLYRLVPMYINPHNGTQHTLILSYNLGKVMVNLKSQR